MCKLAHHGRALRSSSTGLDLQALACGVGLCTALAPRPASCKPRLCYLYNSHARLGFGQAQCTGDRLDCL